MKKLVIIATLCLMTTEAQAGRWYNQYWSSNPDYDEWYYSQPPRYNEYYYEPREVVPYNGYRHYTYRYNAYPSYNCRRYYRDYSRRGYYY
jgi:hypothetical protein